MEIIKSHEGKDIFLYESYRFDDTILSVNLFAFHKQALCKQSFSSFSLKKNKLFKWGHNFGTRIKLSLHIHNLLFDQLLIYNPFQ